ncbi:hypothetical protein D3C72_1981480 [compost metagenome]
MDQCGGGGADYPDLWPGLGVGVGDVAFLPIDPPVLKPEDLHPSQPCQQGQADRRQGGGVFAFGFRLPQSLAQEFELGEAQTPRLRRAGDETHACGWVLLDQADARGVAEDRT